MFLRTFIIVSFALTEGLFEFIVERTCYRRIFSGRRLNEKFIRHSLPCNSLEACQHQCSIEKHFDCRGFNIRLDPANVGRGICELSSVVSTYLDESKDFTFDPEFLYYERVNSNELANCGYPLDVSLYGREGGYGLGPKPLGGPYGRAHSYGPWTGERGNSNREPWGSAGYGRGFHVSDGPLRGPTLQFRPTSHHRPYSYGSGGGRSFQGQGESHVGEKPTRWFSNYSPKHFFIEDDRKYDRPTGIPTYIIIDANANERRYGEPPNLNYLPTEPGQVAPKGGSSDLPSSGDESPMPPHSQGGSRDETTPTTSPKASPQNPDPRNLPFPTRDAALRPHVYPAKPEELPPKPPSHFEPPLPRIEPSYSFQLPGREVCFQRAHPGYRLNPDSIRETYDAPTVLDCEAMCTGSPFKCTGYSFRYSSTGSDTPNCLLTDFKSIVRTSHLLPDRSCDVYFKMNACLDLERTGDTECFLKVGTNKKIDNGKIMKRVLVGSISDCELACLNSYVFTCRSFTFRSGAGIIGEPNENCLLSDWPVSALSLKDFVSSSNYDVYERGSYGHGCELDVGTNVIGPGPPFQGFPIAVPGRGSWSAAETWRHYTVTGWPCKAGTECQLNPIAGFWSCEVEGGEGEQWDYCCMPRHSCGYSRGYNYPWCYVGEAEPQQWRPCSEHYYPELGNRHSNKPAQNFNSHPDDSFGPPRDSGPWDVGNSVSLGLASYWPISYLYAEPPPNETYVWDEDFHHLHHHHHHHTEDEEHYDESPPLRFKPCCHKFPYPKAVVHKLDLTNESRATDPEEQMLSDKPEIPKKVGYRDVIMASNTDLGFSSQNDIKEKDNLINEISKSEEEKESKKNVTEVEKKETDQGKDKLNKSKEVIRTVEKLIEESMKAETFKEKPGNSDQEKKNKK